MKKIVQGFNRSIPIFLMLIINSSLFAQNFTEVIKMIPSDREVNDCFGTAVAISGKNAIIGAPSKWYNDMFYAGAVYVFEQNNEGIWNQAQKIIPADLNSGESFGYSLSISGGYILAGAKNVNETYPDEDPFDYVGSAYIFERNADGVWNQIQKLVASDARDGDDFGSSLCISDNYAIVGAAFEDENSYGEDSLRDAGSAYIFEKNDEGYWIEIQKIVPGNRNKEDHFGSSVSVSGDYAVISAPLKSYNANGSTTALFYGVVYVFKRNTSGEWIEIQEIIPSDRDDINNFGASVSISGDYLIVGADYESYNSVGGDSVQFAGSAYLFERNEGGSWAQVQKLVSSNRAVNDHFGNSVSISGSYAMIGASHTNCDTGYAYVFARNEDGLWKQISSLKSSEYEGNEYFGSSVGISGTSAIAGSWGEKTDALGENTMNYAGAAYLFEKDMCLPSQITDPENIIENGDFGSCVLSPWNIYLIDPAVNTINPELIDGELVLTGITPGADNFDWHIQLLQSFTQEQLNRMEEGASYELSFDARSIAGEKELYVFLGHNSDYWFSYIDERIVAGMEQEHFSIEFTLTSVSSAERVLFGLGKGSTGLILDNVRLVKKEDANPNALIQTKPTDLNIFPNPTAEIIEIDTREPATAALCNSLGMLVKKQKINEGRNKIVVTDLKEGLYFLTIRRGDSVAVQKIIIER